MDTSDSKSNASYLRPPLICVSKAMMMAVPQTNILKDIEDVLRNTPTQYQMVPSGTGV